MLSALGTEVHQFRSAAQCVAYLAAAELQVNGWPELIPSLVENVTSQITEQLKEASLDAIGYICEDLVSVSLILHDQKWYFRCFRTPNF